MLAWLLYSRQFQCFSNSDKQFSRSLVMLSMRERNAAAHGESRMEMPDTGAGHVQILRAARHPSALFQAMRGVPVFGFAKHEVLYFGQVEVCQQYIRVCPQRKPWLHRKEGVQLHILREHARLRMTKVHANTHHCSHCNTPRGRTPHSSAVHSSRRAP